MVKFTRFIFLCFVILILFGPFAGFVLLLFSACFLFGYHIEKSKK